jgi:hypothetical protein
LAAPAIRHELVGALDWRGGVALVRWFADLPACGRNAVTLGFAQVGYLDASGVAAIAFIFKRVLASGRRLTLQDVGGQPLALLHSLGLGPSLRLPQLPALPNTWRARFRPAVLAVQP